MTEQTPETVNPLTVGQVAERFGITVRTLHHYDYIGLVAPQVRTAAGYRLYTDADVIRLQQVVVYRRLGFALDDITALLDEPADVAAHLHRQRAAVTSRLNDLHELVSAIGRALEAHMSGTQLTREERKELFGDGFSDDYAEEAEERWGDTDAWRESRRRTAAYDKQQWLEITAEVDAINLAFAEAQRAGQPTDGERATHVAERHRRHIHEWFYDLSYGMHRGLADLYVSDARFAQTYEAVEPGLAEYVRTAIHANADRRADAH